MLSSKVTTSHPKHAIRILVLAWLSAYTGLAWSTAQPLEEIALQRRDVVLHPHLVAIQFYRLHLLQFEVVEHWSCHVGLYPVTDNERLGIGLISNPYSLISRWFK